MTVAKTNGTTTPTNNALEKAVTNKRSKQIDFDHDDDDEITLEDLAPDGGWGWMVALAMIVVFITTIGPTASFAIVFGDFLEETGQAGTATTLFNSVFMIPFSIAGLMTNALLKKYSMRPVGVVGAILFALPNIALAFAQDVYQMAFIFFIQGIGFGLILTICNTNFNAYFVKRRAQVMSAAQVIIGLGGIAYPIILEKMMQHYGFRGTAAMTGALSLNCIVGMSMMHPVEWHAKKPSEVRAERAREREERKLKGIAISNRRSTIDVIHVSSKAKWSSLRSLKEDGKEAPLLGDTMKAPQTRVSSISEIESGIKLRSKSGSIKELLTRRLSTLSASSVSNLVTGLGAFGDIRQLQMEKGAEPPIKEEGTEAIANTAFSNLFEMSLLKNRCFLNICFGISFAFTSDFTFLALLPLMLTNTGYTQSDAALAVTISATAELVSRILFALFTLFVNVKSKYLFFGAMIVMAFAKLGFLLIYETTLMGAFVAIALIGVVRSWLLVPQPLAIIEDVSIDKFAAAYGIFAVISGVISIVFGPIVGFVKDWTDSFAMCQLALIAMNLLFVPPWTLQFLFVDLPKHREARARKVPAKVTDSLSVN